MLPATPENLVALRTRMGLTQQQAADLLHARADQVADWEAGKAPIDPARWELLVINADEHPDYGPLPLPARAADRR